jgi:hypothetical protein
MNEISLLSYDVPGNRIAGALGTQVVISKKNVHQKKWEQQSTINAHKDRTEKVTWNYPEFGSMLASFSNYEFAVWEEINGKPLSLILL